MTITFVDRIQGYSSYLAQPRHSPLVWQVCKDSFIRDPLILDQLKHYARSPQKLSVLYEMVGFYDRPPRKMPKDDPLLEACFCQARKAFDLSEEGKNKTPMRHINDLEPKMFTLSTNPGLPYAHWGFTKKADVFEMAKKRARYLCHRIKEQQPVRLPPTMIFARNSITERGKRKVRGVWGKPFDLLIAESSIYLPWLERMHQTKKLPNGYKYTMYHRGYRQLWDDITSVSQPGRSTYIMLDFKKYDTTLAPWLLRRARDIIDAQIDFSRYERWGHPVAERSRRLARRLFKATVDTEFLMPDGFLWKKDVGTDSGSLMFQRDEDIATYVIGRYLAARLGHKVEFICVLGDDIIMSIPGRHHIDFNLAASILAEVFGVELNLDKSYSTLEITEASFLGRYLHYGHPRRDTVDIVLSALYPKETDRSLLDVAQRTVALMYENAYVNPHAHKFLTRIWESLPPDIKDYCVSGSFTWDWKWRKIFRTYGLQHPPRCAPPSFDFIFWLLETPDGRFIYHPSGYGT